LSHWHQNLTINIVDDHTAWTPGLHTFLFIKNLRSGTLPPPISDYVEFDRTGAYYYPIFYFNEYWNLNQDYFPLNSTVAAVNLSITYQPMSLFKWQIYASQQMKNKLIFAKTFVSSELFIIQMVGHGNGRRR
jgi:hypothetical protein